MSIFTTYLLIYALYLLVFLLGGWISLQRKNSKVTRENFIGLQNITVIIPFRNEEKRIAPLLESIKHAQSLPAEIIFVDDHSEDTTLALIEHFQNNSITILKLETETGKKRAIKRGVNAAKTDFILTLDADVSFSQSYFTNLGNLPYSDLHILPVKHNSSHFLNRFFQQDVLLAIFLNGAISGWIRPIFCSGANLLFKKDAYLDAVKQPEFFKIDSGDDIFLLREFQRGAKKIEVQTNSSIEVQTELPTHINECIHQRMRWLGKSLKVKDRLANALAQIQFIVAFLNISFLISCLVFMPLKYAFPLMLLKTVLELLFSFDYYRKVNQLWMWPSVPIYLMILPVINAVMLFAFLGFKPRWKGRLVVQ
jgi:glycosyltransferase involved in cell wall biosynthesis